MAVLVTATVAVLGFPFVMQAQDASVPADAVSSPLPTAAADPATAESPFPAELADDGLASPADPVRVTVEAGDLWFSPDEITIDSGQPTVLALTGVGQLAHNLVIDELGIQLSVGPGITSEVTLSDLPPGTYPFYCAIFGHRRAGMFGTLTVVDPEADAADTSVPVDAGSEATSEPVPSPKG